MREDVENVKVLLIHPPCEKEIYQRFLGLTAPPTGLAYVAAALEKDHDHKEPRVQPSKHRTRFDITRMYSTTSAEDNGYVIIELAWNPKDFESMGDRNIMHQIIRM